MIILILKIFEISWLVIMGIGLAILVFIWVKIGYETDRNNREWKEFFKKMEEINLVCEIKPIYFARTVKGEIVNVDKNKKIGDWSIIT